MRLKQINNILLILIILINGYIIAAPLLPVILFSWQSHHGKEQQLASVINKSRGNQPTVQYPDGNTVIIPSMLLSQPILEGPASKTYQILDQGIWRWPYSSTPDKGGNTVLIGHRFTYTNPRGVFYFLNKVAIGDEIGVFWNKRMYVYRVANIEEASPTDTKIENNTPNPELTLFTCTPLWLPKNRLVVVADLEQKPL
jgi:LPXTG-site transpeptidase (sortase) family protein